MKPTAIIDLDGTLIRANSFSIFIAFIAAKALKNVNMPWLIAILWACLMRKCRFTSHASMKKKLLETSEKHLSAADIAALCSKLRDTINPHVANLLNTLRHSHFIVLATAAPALYAQPFAQLVGIDHCIATPSPVKGKHWQENSRQQKLENVELWLDKHNAALDVVVTDHIDDFALFQANQNGKNYLVDTSNGIPIQQPNN